MYIYIYIYIYICIYIYVYIQEPEAPSEVPLYDEAAGKSWPAHGQIVFEDVYMRYCETTSLC